MTRHDRRDRVLVHQLRVSVATQEHAEIIEPRHDALQLNPIDQKDRQWGFVLSDMVQEGVLEILRAVSRHRVVPFLCMRAPSRKLYLPSPGTPFFSLWLTGPGQWHYRALAVA